MEERPAFTAGQSGGPVDVFRSLDLQARAELHLVTRDPVESAPGVAVHQDIGSNSLALLCLYQAANVFVLPTIADCFSFASIEAMAVDLPVISTQIGGTSDMVQPGATGLLVEPGHGPDLASALTRLTSSRSERRSFGKTACERVLRDFDARTDAERILGLVQRVYAGRLESSSSARSSQENRLAR